MRALGVLEAAAQSGLSIGAYAKEAGIDPQRLYWWKRRLERPTPVAEFVEVQRAPSGVGVIEVTLASGDVVRVGGDADAQVLRAVIQALRTC